MRLIIDRTYFDDATLGHLFIEGMVNPVFPTIERPWLNNQDFISCIPEGLYKLKPYSSPKYPAVWEVCGVENRDYVLIHAANWVAELKGCIAPGLSSGYMMLDGKNQKAVTSSGLAIAELKKILKYPSEHELLIRS